MTLDADTGLITGTCVAPNGGLYNFTITATNDYGSVEQDFAILIDGTAPTTDGYGGVECIYVIPSGPSTWNPTNVAGSTGGNPAVPITYSFSGTPDSQLNAAIDASSGVLTFDPDAVLIGDYAQFPAVRLTNYFGSYDTAVGPIPVMAPVYWGEWHGALPGTFTENNILVDVFDNVTPGPRIASCHLAYTWLYINPFLAYPTTSSAYARILAIPQNLLTGDVMQDHLPGTIFLCDATNTAIPCAALTPAWPTPYQSGLTINGVLYDIYVITARTLAISITGNS